MCGDEPLLDVRAGAHLLGAAEEHAHRAVSHLLEEDLLLGVRVGVADRGDVLAGDAVLHQLGDDVGIDRVAPGRGVDPQIGKDQLRAACRGRALPDGRDVLDEGVDLGVGEIRRRGESSRASSASLRPSVVMASALSSQGFTCPERIAS